MRIYPAVDIPLWVDTFGTTLDGSSVYNEIVGDLRLLQRKKASRFYGRCHKKISFFEASEKSGFFRAAKILEEIFSGNSRQRLT